MQQLFNEYIFQLTKVYTEILEEVSLMSKVMSSQAMSNRNETPLGHVVRLDENVSILKKKYPQYDYITQAVFGNEEMFDNKKGNIILFPEFFPEYGEKEIAIKSFLMRGIAPILKEKESDFLLNYLENNGANEGCWSGCFAAIYKNHQFLRSKAMSLFCDFLDKKDILKAACGKDVISIFDRSQTSVQNVIKLLQKIYEKSNPNYSFISEKKQLDDLHFFHYLPLNEIPKKYTFIRMLYHTRYLNSCEFEAACSNMSVSKITDYDFSLAQRILPRLLVYLSRVSYEEAVSIVRNKKNYVPATYLENGRWLAEHALAFAEIFGMKYDAYLNKVLPFLKLDEAGSFIKDIDYGNPKNKELGKFLMNNVVYQKSNNFNGVHDTTELEKICRAWKNIPLDGIKAKKYRKVLSLCDTYFYKKINHVPFSREAIYWNMLEKDYIRAEKIYMDAQQSPAPFNTQTVWEDGEYRGRFLPRSDVRVGFFGHYTGCCQHYTGTGSTAAISCVKDPSSQLFVIEKKGRIIAGSFVWRTDVKEQRCVCFDSVEVLGSYEGRKEIYNIYQMVYNDLCKKYRKVTFGKTPFELVNQVRPLPIPKDVYTDARAQFVLPVLQKEKN